MSYSYGSRGGQPPLLLCHMYTVFLFLFCPFEALERADCNFILMWDGDRNDKWKQKSLSPGALGSARSSLVLSLEQAFSECSFGHHPDCCFWGRFQFEQGNPKWSNNKICLSSSFLFALLMLLCSQFLTFLLVQRDLISPCSYYLKWNKSPSPSPPGFHGLRL